MDHDPWDRRRKRGGGASAGPRRQEAHRRLVLPVTVWRSVSSTDKYRLITKCFDGYEYHVNHNQSTSHPTEEVLSLSQTHMLSMFVILLKATCPQWASWRVTPCSTQTPWDVLHDKLLPLLPHEYVSQQYSKRHWAVTPATGRKPMSDLHYANHEQAAAALHAGPSVDTRAAGVSALCSEELLHSKWDGKC